MKLSHYGIREWGTACAVVGAVVGIVLFINPGLGVKLGILVPLAIVLLAVMWFFRDPRRRLPKDWQPSQFVSPADGVISSIEHLDHHEDLGGPALVIRVFLSVLDVHVNRYPCDGAAISIRHVTGRHHDARSEQCPRENEHNLMLIRRDDGIVIGVRQIAGLIARRIVCQATPGSPTAAGERFGMIKFGSSTELILPRPENVAVAISQGQRVRAGETVLAAMQPCEPG